MLSIIATIWIWLGQQRGKIFLARLLAVTYLTNLVIWIAFVFYVLSAGRGHKLFILAMPCILVPGVANAAALLIMLERATASVPNWLRRLLQVSAIGYLLMAVLWPALG
jgi:hypothetical protein